jgi:hypothetical protein
MIFYNSYIQIVTKLIYNLGTVVYKCFEVEELLTFIGSKTLITQLKYSWYNDLKEH